METTIIIVAAVFGTVLAILLRMKRLDLFRLRLGPSHVDLEAWTAEALRAEPETAREPRRGG